MKCCEWILVFEMPPVKVAVADREGHLPVPRVQHLLLGWTSPDFTLTFLSVCFGAEGRLRHGLGSLQEVKGHF